MARTPANPQLSASWKRFVARYATDHAYWYQPKGLAVTAESIRARLEILSEFEGTRPWRECQAEYVTRLRDDGVSAADGSALARMLKQVMAVLGLAWVDPSDLVEITPTGQSFLTADDGGQSVLAAQTMRYQFWNPVVSSRVLREVRLHPVPFLVRLLQAVDGNITSEEYALFVAKAKNPDDVDRVADHIDLYRQLVREEQLAIVRSCESYGIGGPKRASIYNTIRLNRPYAVKMWALSGLVTVDGNHALQLVRSAIRHDTRAWLESYTSKGTYIEFSDEKEFVAWMGDQSLQPDRATALDIYTSRGDIDSAAHIKKAMGASSSELKHFRQMMISEKTLEDSIEADFDEFGRQIGRSLKIVGRQYSTTVGPIDLLAQDRKSGEFVVIELKKGRSADKVFGQLSRYMGWVRKNLATGQNVVGVIVGSGIDDKLRAARDAHDTEVLLVEYDSRVAVRVV